MQEAFDALPKSRHWRNLAQFKHPEATPERIMTTLLQPTLPVEQHRRGRTRYYKYLADADVWFRVVLNQDGALLTAFADAQAMERLGRP